jgi:dephospho-CoA kinase
MGRVIGLTGEIGSGKSCALYAFGLLGARFLSLDHLAWTIGQGKVLEDDEYLSIVTERIAQYRSANPVSDLVFEVSLWVVEAMPHLFDEIVVITSNRKIRAKRLSVRIGQKVKDVEHLTWGDFKYTFGVTKYFANNKAKIDLWRDVETWWRKRYPGIPIEWKVDQCME